ncbi:MAG: DNA polymerase Y family protein [Planctomycetes bacterium]|nr:DNA polymerase Y family protein [Planctomycetota bacterium]
MKRALCVYLPMWSIDLVRRRMVAASRGRRDRRALVLVETDGHGQRVARCCARARKAGVTTGMTLAHARALMPIDGVRLEPFEPERDDAALRSLARWAMRFSPVVAVDPPDGLLLDITGCDRLFGGDRRLVARVGEALDRLGFAHRVAAGPTFGVAWAVARFGGQARAVVADDGATEAMRPLPIASLRVADETVEALDEVGVTRVGEVLALPRSTLPSRFGAELLLRIDQALGSAIETIEPVRPSLPVSVERVFDGPATQAEAIELAAHELLGELCEKLARRESGARRVTLELDRSDLGPLALTVTLSRASRDAGHLWALLRPRLERADHGFGVERVMLQAWPIERLAHEQISRWHEGPRDQEAELGRLLDTLVNRLGQRGVTRASVVQTHVPERACRRVAATGAGTSPGVRTDEVEAPPRPPLLLTPAEKISVTALTPDGPPRRIGWSGGQSEVTASLGPERIAGEWWRRGEPTRDYFAVQDDRGRWLWVYHELETGRWFLHGRWS